MAIHICTSIIDSDKLCCDLGYREMSIKCTAMTESLLYEILISRESSANTFRQRFPWLSPVCLCSLPKAHALISLFQII